MEQEASIFSLKSRAIEVYRQNMALLWDEPAFLRRNGFRAKRFSSAMQF